jgi:hypothetical protein
LPWQIEWTKEKKMKRLGSLLAFAILALLVPLASAQEKTKTTETVKAVVPLKVTVVFTEFEGEKKLNSLPYALFLKTDERERFVGRVRVGVRVPIWTGAKDSQVQYQDVGSNLDCWAQAADDGRYVLDLSLERSSIYPSSAGKDDHSTEGKSDDQPHYANQPMLRTFRANLALMLRDGQTTQSTVATDPLNGHVVKVDVTLNVLK